MNTGYKTKSISSLYGVLIKNEEDVQLLERLAFMASYGKTLRFLVVRKPTFSVGFLFISIERNELLKTVK